MPRKKQVRASGDSAGDLLGALGGGGSTGDALGGILGGLLGAGQAGRGSSQGAGAGALGGILGGLLSGGQQGTTPAAGGLNDNTFLRPIVDGLAAKFGISPQVAESVVSIALTYVLSGQGTPALKKMGKGKAGRKSLLESGLVSQLSDQTGLDSETAATSLQQVFQALGSQMAGG